MTKTLTKNKGGRPKIVLSKKQIEEVGELAKRLTTEQIADYLGIAQATFYEIQKRQPALALAYKKGKQKGVNWVISKLMQKIEDGDTAATIFYIKTQAGWSEKQQIDMNANISGSTFPQFIFEVDGKSKKD